MPLIDVAYQTAVDFVFGRIVLHHPTRLFAVLEGLLALTSVLAVLAVLALLVPSSGKRTALLGLLLCLGPATALFFSSVPTASLRGDRRAAAPSAPAHARSVTEGK